MNPLIMEKHFVDKPVGGFHPYVFRVLEGEDPGVQMSKEKIPESSEVATMATGDAARFPVADCRPVKIQDRS